MINMDKIFRKSSKFKPISVDINVGARLAKEIIRKNKETIELLKH